MCTGRPATTSGGGGAAECAGDGDGFGDGLAVGVALGKTPGVTTVLGLESALGLTATIVSVGTGDFDATTLGPQAVKPRTKAPVATTASARTDTTTAGLPGQPQLFSDTVMVTSFDG